MSNPFKDVDLEALIYSNQFELLTVGELRECLPYDEANAYVVLGSPDDELQPIFIVTEDNNVEGGLYVKGIATRYKLPNDTELQEFKDVDLKALIYNDQIEVLTVGELREFLAYEAVNAYVVLGSPDDDLKSFFIVTEDNDVEGELLVEVINTRYLRNDTELQEFKDKHIAELRAQSHTVVDLDLEV